MSREIGIKGLERLLPKGVADNAAVLLETQSNKESLVLGTAFVNQTLQAGEKVILILSEIPPGEFLDILEEGGAQPYKAIEEGRLSIIDWYSQKKENIVGIEEAPGVYKCSIDHINVQIALGYILEKFENGAGIKALVDGISTAIKLHGKEAAQGFAENIVDKLRAAGVLSLFLAERKQKEVGEFHPLFDGVIEVKRKKRGSKFIKTIGVVSFSDTEFSSQYLPINVEGALVWVGGKKDMPKPPEKPELPGAIADSGGGGELRLSCSNCGSILAGPLPECPICGHKIFEGAPGEGGESEEKIEEMDGFWYSGDHASIYLCSECGAFITEDAEKCPSCGKDVSTEATGEAPEVDFEKAAKEIDGYWYKGDTTSLFLCPECGAFIREDSTKCQVCGVEFAEGEEGEEEVGVAPPEEGEEEGDGFWYKGKTSALFLCPDCGAFNPENIEKCVVCGADLGVEAEEVEETTIEELEKDIDGFWYRGDSSFFRVCPNCGAFLTKDEERCPVCDQEITVERIEGIEDQKLDYWYRATAEDQEEALRKALGVLEEGVEGPREKEDKGIYLCPECGAFVGEDAVDCSICGASLEEEVIEEEELDLEAAESVWAEDISELSQEELEEMLELEGEILELGEAPAEKGIYEEVEAAAEEAEIEAGLEQEVEGFIEEGPTDWREEITELPEEAIEEIVDIESEIKELEAIPEGEWGVVEELEKVAVEAEIAHEMEGLLGEEKEGWAEDVSELPEEALEEIVDLESEIMELEGAEPGVEEKVAEPSVVEAFMGPAGPKPEPELEETAEVTEVAAEAELVHEIEEAVVEGYGLEELDALEEEIQKLEHYTCSECGASIAPGETTCNVCGALFEEALMVENLFELAQVFEERPELSTRPELAAPRRTRGLTNGIGLVNGQGLTNGLTAGLTNGMINGMGRINGLVNGMGRVNGLVNGMGRVNGLINGNGLVNGTGGRIGYVRPPRSVWRSRPEVLAVVILFSLMLMTPFYIYFALVPSPAPGIAIDGEFGDWAGIYAFEDVVDDQTQNQNINLVSYSLHFMKDTFNIYLRVNGDMFGASGESVEAMNVLIDSDSSPSTGYLAGGIGAEYLVRITGFDDMIATREVYRYSAGADQYNWTQFRKASSVNVAVDGSELEAQLSLGKFRNIDRESTSVLVLAEDSSGNGDLSDVAVASDQGALRVTQELLDAGPIAPSQGGVPLSLLRLNAYQSDATLDGLYLKMAGNLDARHIIDVELFEDADGGGQMTSSDRRVPSSASVLSDGVSLDLTGQYTVREGDGSSLIVVVQLSASAPAGSTIGLVLEGDEPVIGNYGRLSIESLGTQVSYIAAPTEGIVIDGLFGDWDELPLDLDGNDDYDGGQNENVDINLHGASLNDSDLSFFVGVDGNMLGGALLPVKLSRYVVPETLDSDGDKIRDIYEPGYEHDFDDDGTPDAVDSDDDNDGVADYPNGDDWWLNRTATGASLYIGPRPPADRDRDGIPDQDEPGFEFDFDNDGIPHDQDPDDDGDNITDYPAGPDMWMNDPTDGRSRWYIGPAPKVAMPRVTGEDVLRLLINADSNQSTGYTPQDSPTPFGAEYMVEVRGREGQILATSVHGYDALPASPGGAFWRWTEIDEDVTAAKDSSRIEVQFNVSALTSSRSFEVMYYASDWASTYDASSSQVIGLSRFAPMSQRGPGDETKTLYMHPGDQMNTTVGSVESSLTLMNGQSNTWLQAPPFASDFNLTGDIPVHLYIVPQPTGVNKPTVTVTLFNGTAQLGSYSIPDVGTPGWYTFFITPSSTLIPEGNDLRLQVSVTGNSAGLSATVCYGSAQNNSRVVLTTNTYIEIEWLRTYNLTSGSQTTTYIAGETVEIRANVSDPLGVYDISDVRLTVYYPNGTVMYDNVPMALFQQDPDALKSWSIYNNSFALPADAVGGSYMYDVTATESNGVVSTSYGIFIIPIQPGLIFYPDQSKSAPAGSTVDYQVTLMNIGNTNDTYVIDIGGSSRGWPTRLYMGAALLAEDSDGDGDWDWIDPAYAQNGGVGFQLDPLDSIVLTVRKTVPVTAEGDLDVTTLTASSRSYPGVVDNVTLTTNVPLPSKIKTLHLHTGDAMNTTQGVAGATVNIPNGGSRAWTQIPALASDFVVADYMMVHLYLVPYAQGNRYPDITATLRYGGTLIGSQTLSDLVAPGWYQFSINPAGTIPKGAALTLVGSVSDQGTSVDVLYDSQLYDSMIDIPTSTYIQVRSSSTYDGLGVQTSSFGAGEAVEIRANITDPLGIQDIASANLTVIAPNGTVLVNDAPMLQYLSDPGNFWRVYNHTLVLPLDADAGTYSYSVRGVESNGVFHTLQYTFTVPTNVSVTPDHSILVGPSTIVELNHTITNTGRGRDTFEMTLSTVQAWNVSLYVDTDGDGVGDVLMAEDWDGDGSWDYLNGIYDTTGDGNPDTGSLKRGESFNITMRAQVPLDFNQTNVITITATSERFPSIADSAVDTIGIPEFSSMWVPVISMVALAFFFAGKKRKNRAMDDTVQ